MSDYAIISGNDAETILLKIKVGQKRKTKKVKSCLCGLIWLI